ncbi:hypothetical protein E4U14_001367 [Claviceps sp. LM454 group G7]|nr:hypothetical protein E4U14_001367 [Claviceps sp. LM454 group G7]
MDPTFTAGHVANHAARRFTAKLSTATTLIDSRAPALIGFKKRRWPLQKPAQSTRPRNLGCTETSKFQPSKKPLAIQPQQRSTLTLIALQLAFPRALSFSYSQPTRSEYCTISPPSHSKRFSASLPHWRHC